MIKWIKVEDKFPKDAEWVLIYADSEGVRDKLVTMAFYQENECDDGNEHYWLCHNDTQSISEWEGVTHWAEMPNPPKEL